MQSGFLVLGIKPTIFWLILFIVMLVLEAVTLGLTSIWFAAGTLTAMLLSFTRIGFLAQVVVCIAVSVLLLILVRPWARERFNRRRTRTNAQSLIDQDGVVMEEIDNLKAQGRVTVSGQEWAARNVAETEAIPVGATVTVREIRGVRLLVEVKKEQEKAEEEENA